MTGNPKCVDSSFVHSLLLSVAKQQGFKFGVIVVFLLRNMFEMSITFI
jgi:hypothetical protein